MKRTAVMRPLVLTVKRRPTVTPSQLSWLISSKVAGLSVGLKIVSPVAVPPHTEMDAGSDEPRVPRHSPHPL